MAKAGAVMSADRRARLQAAIDALQALLEEAMPTEASTTEKGHRMTAYEEIVTLATAMVEKGLAPTKHQAVAKLAHDRPDLRRRYYDEPKPHLVAKREELPARHWSLVKLEAMAQELVAKGKAPTRAQGMVLAMKTNEGRELAAAYRERTRG